MIVNSYHLKINFMSFYDGIDQSAMTAIPSFHFIKSLRSHAFSLDFNPIQIRHIFTKYHCNNTFLKRMK